MCNVTDWCKCTSCIQNTISLTVCQPFTHTACSVFFTHCVWLKSLNNGSPCVRWLSCPLPLNKHIGITPHQITGLCLVCIQCWLVNIELDSNLKPLDLCLCSNTTHKILQLGTLQQRIIWIREWLHNYETNTHTHYNVLSTRSHKLLILCESWGVALSLLDSICLRDVWVQWYPTVSVQYMGYVSITQ